MATPPPFVSTALERLDKTLCPKHFWAFILSKHNNTRKGLDKVKKDETKLDKHLAPLLQGFRDSQRAAANRRSPPSNQNKGRITVSTDLDLVYLPTANGIKAGTVTATRLTQSTFGYNCSGYLVLRPSACQTILCNFKDTFNPKPLALLVPANLGVLQEKDAETCTLPRFRPTQVELPIAIDNKAVPITYKCVLLQLGTEDIAYHDTLISAPAPVRPSTPLSVRVYKSDFDPKMYADLGNKSSDSFRQLVTKVLGSDIIFDRINPQPTFRKPVHLRGADDEEQGGVVHIHTNRLSEALRRSGRNKVFLHTLDPKANPAKTAVIRLPRATTHEDALMSIDKIGQLSYGLVPTRLGYAIRVRDDPKTSAQVKSLVDPHLAKSVGEELMTMAPEQGVKYIIKNVDSHLNFCELTNILSENFQWKVRPERVLKGAPRAGFHNVLLTSRTHPPVLDGCIQGAFFKIVEFVPPAVARKSPWDRVFTALAQREQDCEAADDDDDADTDARMHPAHGDSADPFAGVETSSELSAGWGLGVHGEDSSRDGLLGDTHISSPSLRPTRPARASHSHTGGAAADEQSRRIQGIVDEARRLETHANDQFRRIDTAITDLNTKLESVTTALTSLNGTVNRMQATLTSLERLAAMADGLENLSTQLTQLTADRNAANETAAANAQQIRVLAARVDGMLPQTPLAAIPDPATAAEAASQRTLRARPSRERSPHGSKKD